MLEENKTEDKNIKWENIPSDIRREARNRYTWLAVTSIFIGMAIAMMAIASLWKSDEFHAQEIERLKNIHANDLVQQENAFNIKLSKELDSLEQMLTSPVLYKPRMTLSDTQNSLCLAIMLFGEERMGNEEDMVKLAQTVVMRAEDRRWGKNACTVIRDGNGVQYSSMGPFLVDIADILDGEIDDFTPALAKKNAQEMQAWKRIKKIAFDIVDGNYPLMTRANHFISLKELKEIKNWIRNVRVVGYTTGHVLLIDYEMDEEGNRVIYTAEKPYNQKSFNEGSWEEFDREL